jgi:hypothetical protein
MSKDLSSEAPIRDKIKFYVEEYKRLFPYEYLDFKSMMRQKQLAQADKFSEVKQTDLLERALIEYPATLFAIFQMKLTEDEMEKMGSKKMARWMHRTYPEFRVAEKL